MWNTNSGSFVRKTAKATSAEKITANKRIKQKHSSSTECTTHTANDFPKWFRIRGSVPGIWAWGSSASFGSHVTRHKARETQYVLVIYDPSTRGLLQRYRARGIWGSAHGVGTRGSSASCKSHSHHTTTTSKLRGDFANMYIQYIPGRILATYTYHLLCFLFSHPIYYLRPSFLPPPSRT